MDERRGKHELDPVGEQAAELQRRLRRLSTAARPETCAGYQDKNWRTDFTSLWNGGQASGTLRLTARRGELVTQLTGSHGGCEHGRV